MSILKMVNENGTEKKRMYAKDDYLTAASKTDNGKLVGSSNCMSRYVVEEMLAVKRVFHKSGGRSWVEGVVSLTPDLKSRTNDEYMEIAREIVSLFPEFQCRYVVHLDSRFRHIHFMLNTVSVWDGHKYTQSPSGLQRIKQQVNDILLQHHFDIIKMGAEEMLDLTDHSEDETFDYLEMDEPLIDLKAVTVRNEIDIRTQGVKTKEYVTMNIPFINNGQSAWSSVSTASSVKDANAGKQPMLPQPLEKGSAFSANSPMPLTEPVQQSRPTISANIAPHYIVNVNSDKLDEDTFSYAERFGQTTAEQLNNGANMLMALFGAADAKGYDVNIAVNAAPTVEINLNGDIRVDDSKIVIDSDYTVEE